MRVVRTLLGATLVCDHHRLPAVGLRGVLSQLWRLCHMRQATVCSVIVDRLENVLEVPHGPLLHHVWRVDVGMCFWSMRVLLLSEG